MADEDREKKDNPFEKKDEGKKDDISKADTKSEDKAAGEKKDDGKDDKEGAKGESKGNGDGGGAEKSEPFAKKWRAKAKEAGVNGALDGIVGDDTPDEEAKARHDEMVARITRFFELTHTPEEEAQELETIAQEIREEDPAINTSGEIVAASGDGAINTPTEVAGALEVAADAASNGIPDEELQEFKLDVDGDAQPDVAIEVQEDPLATQVAAMAIPSDEEFDMPRGDSVTRNRLL